MTSLSARTTRTLMVLVGLSVALVIAAVITVAMRPTPQALDPETPEGTVQQFVLALQANDAQTVSEYYDSTKKQLCVPDWDQQSTFQIKLKSTSVTNNSATVTVAITEGPEEFAFLSGYGYSDVFELSKTSGKWQVSVAPWPFSLCTDEELG